MLSETAIQTGFYGYQPFAASHQRATGHWPTRTRGDMMRGPVPPGCPADRRQ